MMSYLIESRLRARRGLRDAASVGTSRMSKDTRPSSFFAARGTLLCRVWLVSRSRRGRPR